MKGCLLENFRGIVDILLIVTEGTCLYLACCCVQNHKQAHTVTTLSSRIIKPKGLQSANQNSFTSKSNLLKRKIL